MLSIVFGLRSCKKETCKNLSFRKTIGNCLKMNLMRGQHKSVTDLTLTLDVR